MGHAFTNSPFRERTKQQVAHLEGLVRTLQAANERPEQLSDLLAQVDKGREEIRRLKDTLSRVHLLTVPGNGLTKTGKGKRGDKDRDASTSPNGSFDQVNTPPDDSFLQDVGTHDITGDQYLFDSHTVFGSPSVFSTLDMPTSVSEPGRYQVLSEEGIPLKQRFIPPTKLSKPLDAIDSNENDPVVAIATQILANPRLEGRWLVLAGSVLNHCLGTDDELMTPRILDDDIAIRACVEGWETVRRMYFLDDGWRWLRQLDENMYFHLSWPQRMAIMKIQRMQYLVRRLVLGFVTTAVNAWNRFKEANQQWLTCLVS